MLHALVAAGAAALGVIALTPLVIRLAHRRGWVAHPKADRWHQTPTALMGGLALFGAAALALGVAFAAGVLTEVPLPGVLAGATLMFGVGVWDDRRPLRPIVKLLFQVLAAVLALWDGVGLSIGPLIVSVPLTLLWLVGLTNAVNLLDNMDGLASGVAAIAALVLGLFGLLNGQTAAMVLCMAVAGAAGGFLVFNFNPARIFMGDGGSLFLGYTVGALALVVSAPAGQAGFLGVLFVPVAVMAVPIFDTTLVTLMRSVAGRAVSQGGRDHSSHRLVMLGLSERKAVLLLYGVSALFGGGALLFEVLDARFSVAALLVLVGGLAVLGRVLSGLRIYEPEAVPQGRLARLLHAGDGVVIETVLLYKRQVLAFLLDVVLATAMHLAAYGLRFEGTPPAYIEQTLAATLPFVILWKMASFAMVGLHQQVWRYTGVDEIARVALAVGLSSTGLVLGYFVFFERGFFSVSVVFIDALLTFGVLSSARLAVRALQMMALGQRGEHERVLIYGAGDAGVAVLSELRRNRALALKPVGFVDDDVSKYHKSVMGVRVLGTGADLPGLCRAYDAHHLFLAAPAMPPAQRAALLTQCEALKVQVSVFTMSVQVLLPRPAGDGPTGDGHPTPAVAPEPLRQPGVSA